MDWVCGQAAAEQPMAKLISSTLRVIFQLDASNWAFSDFGDDFLDFEAVAAKQFRHDERLVKNVDRVGEKIETFEDRIARINQETKFVDLLLDDLFGEGDASSSSSVSSSVTNQVNYLFKYNLLTFF